uniref:Uncharacterized protein n=2 Tax=unclassified Prevotella TaxID=2638335 RepID=A0AB33JRA4_9BACT
MEMTRTTKITLGLCGIDATYIILTLLTPVRLIGNAHEWMWQITPSLFIFLFFRIAYTEWRQRKDAVIGCLMTGATIVLPFALLLLLLQLYLTNAPNDEILYSSNKYRVVINSGAFVTNSDFFRIEKVYWPFVYIIKEGYYDDELRKLDNPERIERFLRENP